MPFQFLELLCCMADLFAGGAALGGAVNAQNQSKAKLNSPEDRRGRRARSCALDDCRVLTFRSTDYCWKHQDATPPDPEPEPEPEADANWWEEQTE